MLEMARANRAAKKGDKLIGLGQYKEASDSYEYARQLYRHVGEYDRAAAAGFEARAAMKLAAQVPKNAPLSAVPSPEMQAVAIERWKKNISETTVHRTDVMTLLVANEKKLARKY